MRTRFGRLALIIFVLLLFPAQTSAQAPSNFCADNQVPGFVFGFADLRTHIGAAMGEPLTCEFADPNGTGDVHQRTTTGLAFWRKSTNTPTFTDGYHHWGHTPAGWVTWLGDSIDPPGVTVPAQQTVSRSPMPTATPVPPTATVQPSTPTPTPTPLAGRVIAHDSGPAFPGVYVVENLDVRGRYGVRVTSSVPRYVVHVRPEFEAGRNVETSWQYVIPLTPDRRTSSWTDLVTYGVEASDPGVNAEPILSIDLIEMVAPPTATPFPTFAPAPSSGRDYNCSDFSTWRQAQDFFLANGGPGHDPYGLDADHDGTACESLPGAPRR